MRRILCITPLLLLLTACFALPVEEPVPPPPLIRAGDAVTYRTAPVVRGDVVLYRDMPASYVAAREEVLFFSMTDIYIKAVNVELGDYVYAGDIIAELDRDSIQRELESAAQDEAWLRLSLRQLDERHNLDLTQAGLTGRPLDESQYEAERGSLLTRLEALNIRVEHLRNEDQRRVLRAGMDGVITFVINASEGDVSQDGQRIARIADQTRSVFSVRSSEISLIKPDTRYDLLIGGEPHGVMLAPPESLGISRLNSDEVYLVMLDEVEEPQFSDRTYATLHVVLEQADDVLMVSNIAIKKANARVFVYVLDEGVRTIRDIELGLEGNMFSEIVGGLAENELIIFD